MKFKDFIDETIINLFDKEKEEYKDIVWELLISSYSSIGGIKGSGFESKEAMIKRIKMWKLAKKNNKIVAGILYKDKNDIRKSVAIFTDGSKEGKVELAKMLKDDFSRSSIEVSHDLLKFIERKMPIILKKYVIDTKYVSDILGKDIKIIDDKKYERDINGTKVIKMMLGTQKSFK